MSLDLFASNRQKITSNEKIIYHWPSFTNGFNGIYKRMDFCVSNHLIVRLYDRLLTWKQNYCVLELYETGERYFMTHSNRQSCDNCHYKKEILYQQKTFEESYYDII